MLFSRSFRSNVTYQFSQNFMSVSRPFRIVEENNELGKYLKAVNKSPIFQNLNDVAFQQLAKKHKSSCAIKHEVVSPFELEPYLLSSADERRLFCIHEAGHVIITRLNPIWRRTVLSVHMSQPSLTITQAREKYVEDCWLSNRTLVIGELANILGGIAAEEIFYEGSCVSKGVRSDLLAFAETATMHVFEKGIPHMYSSCGHNAYIEELYQEASYISTSVLKKHKDKISMMANELYSVDRIGRDRIDEILFSGGKIEKSFKNGHICSFRREPVVHDPPVFLKLRNTIKESLLQMYVATPSRDTPSVPSPVPSTPSSPSGSGGMDGSNREVSLPQSHFSADPSEDQDRLRKSIHEMGHAIAIRTNPIKSYFVKSISLSDDDDDDDGGIEGRRRRGKSFSVGSSTIIVDPSCSPKLNPAAQGESAALLDREDKKVNTWQYDKKFLLGVIINHLGGIAAELVLYDRKINTIRFESDIDICAEVMARSAVLAESTNRSAEEQIEYVKQYSKDLHDDAIRIAEALVKIHKEKLLVLAKELSTAGRLDGSRIDEVLITTQPTPLVPVKMESSWLDWLLSKV